MLPKITTGTGHPASQASAEPQAKALDTAINGAAVNSAPALLPVDAGVFEDETSSVESAPEDPRLAGLAPEFREQLYELRQVKVSADESKAKAAERQRADLEAAQAKITELCKPLVDDAVKQLIAAGPRKSVFLFSTCTAFTRPHWKPRTRLVPRQKHTLPATTLLKRLLAEPDFKTHNLVDSQTFVGMLGNMLRERLEGPQSPWVLMINPRERFFGLERRLKETSIAVTLSLKPEFASFMENVPAKLD